MRWASCGVLLASRTGTRRFGESAFEKEDFRRSAVPTGTIKKVVSERGFGFIDGEDGTEYFFHRSAIDGEFDHLRGGERVTFKLEPSPKGPRAAEVRLA
jgi:CspA family cold shock protein